MKRFFEILPKIFSLLIAGFVVFCAIYYFPQWGTEGELSSPKDDFYDKVNNSILSILVLIGWLITSLGCIWFGEYVSEEVELHDDWGPTWFIKFIGWLLLLIPVIGLVYYKMLR
ncbi:MAG: hypothetical protein JW749_00205 [Sedimentisphaerales bacterium]|nr:hypothetical protein [Sedimentisphaerales bacterium]